MRTSIKPNAVSFSELIQVGYDLLKGSKQVETPKLDSQWLAEHLVFGDRQFGTAWNNRWVDSQKNITPQIQKKFLKKIAERKAGVPLAYLIGEKHFLSYRFFVSRGVLVPRPETELLVEKAVERTLANLKKQSEDFLVTDLGAGSGCIGISFYLHLQKKLELQALEKQLLVRLLLVDQSKKAVDLVKKNLVQFEIKNARVVHSKVEKLKLKKQSQAVILANPPYIGRDEWVQPSVRQFEPKAALFSEDSGYRATRIWAKRCWDWLRPQGLLGFEINPLHLKQFQTDLSRWGFVSIFSVKDYSGFDRFVFAEKPEVSETDLSVRLQGV